MPENKPAAAIYMVSQGQMITAGMGQVIDINNLAVFGAMDRYPGGIKDQWKCLHKVRAAFDHFKPKNEGKS